MRIFLDTNILLDVYLNRPGMAQRARVISACGEPWNEGCVTVQFRQQYQHATELARQGL